MSAVLVVHVGLMKSGTTYLQGRLNANRARLAEQGILFPGPSWARHARGVTDLLQLPQGKPGAWASIRDEIREHPGTSIISMEYLGPIRQSRIDQLVGDFPGFEIRIVITARDLGRSVPAMWQETIKNRRTWAWPDYLESIRNGGEAGDAFWRQQALATITQRWVKGTSASQVTIVTVPPPGAAPEELWDRFSKVAGISPAAWDDAPRADESLGAQSAAMMRRLNAELESLSRQEYKNRVKALAKHTMGTRRGDEDTIGFTVPDWLKERAREDAAVLERLGVPIIGDLAELAPLDVAGVDPATVDAAGERDAAVAALAAVLREGRGAMTRKRKG